MKWTFSIDHGVYLFLLIYISLSKSRISLVNGIESGVTYCQLHTNLHSTEEKDSLYIGMGKRKGNTKTFGGLAGFLTTLGTGTGGSISPQPDVDCAAAKWEQELVDVEKGNKNGKEGGEGTEDERSGKRRRVDQSESGIGHGENGTSGGANQPTEAIVVSRSVVKKGTGWDDWEGGWIKKYDMSRSVRHLEQLEGLDDQDENDGLEKCEFCL